MKYFRKTKFRESSLIIVALFVAIVYFTTNIISYEQSKDVQELIDARVEEALKEATTTTFPNNTTTTSPYPFEYDSILIGYVTDVRLNDKGKVTGILISDMLWTGPGSSVQLYRFNRKIDEWDFELGDYVVAVLVGPMLTSDPAYQAASRIYIITEFKPVLYLPEN
ncbi:hypothetical protein N9P11_03480 [Acidimicrobiia bacterium]|nr:hypothetical protein [Acidimicrobiia bacterium]